jgi:NADPH:quinone reductase-like Zn-dependent oxidoreductase
MKAMVYHTYGSPDVLALAEVPKPVPRDNEVLISVHAAAVSTTDCAARKGEPFMVRLFSGLTRPKLLSYAA